MNARDGTHPRGKPMLLTGNHAVAWAARLARPKVVPLYPITPQTPILEKITEFQANGEFDAEVITPESEHSVMAACIPASARRTPKASFFPALLRRRPTRLRSRVHRTRSAGRPQ